jgi:CelD/BcsL family acetyltransferase involved in cellulose biosynthesis
VQASQTNVDAQQTVEVEIYHNFEELDSIKKEWDEFIESIGSEIFLTFDWCRIWWKYYGRKRDLKVFLFRQEGRLIGIIPLFCEKLCLGPVCVRAAKIVGSDFTLTQFGIPLDLNYMKAILKRFCEKVLELEWDIIHIGPVTALYKHTSDLKNTLAKSFGDSYRVLSEENNVQTCFELGDNWETYLTTLSKRDRGDISRNYRYIGRTIDDASAQVVSRFADASDLEGIFDEFVEMHQKHWIKLGKGGHFGDWPDARNFHLEVAKAQLQKNRLRLLKVMIKDYCLGYEYNYKFGETFFQFLNARSDIEQLKSISVGKIVFGELVKRALDEKVRYIDSMRGKYEYKLRLGGKLFPIRSLNIIPRNAVTMVRIKIFRILARLLNLCYYRIWFCRLAPRLHFKRKALRKIWIRTCVFS